MPVGQSRTNLQCACVGGLRNYKQVCYIRWFQGFHNWLCAKAKGGSLTVEEMNEN